MSDLRRLVNEISSAGVHAELWVDGSFCTEKTDPNDIDLVIHLDGSLLLHTAAIALLTSISQRSYLRLGLDAYLFSTFPTGHPAHQFGEERRAYWLKQFGHDRSGNDKGIVFVRIP